jgi:hypothetical protein
VQGCSDLFKLPPLLRVLGSSPNNTKQRWGAMCVVMMHPTTVTTEPPPCRTAHAHTPAYPAETS